MTAAVPPPSNVTPIVSDARRYLNALFAGVDGFIDIRLFTANNSKRVVAKTIDHADKIITREANHLGVNVHPGVATRITGGTSKGEGGKDNLQAVGAVWVDIDYKAEGDAERLEKKLPALPPVSMRVHSGGGVHLYWLLDEPYKLEAPEAVERFENVLKGIAANLDGDMAVTDASHVLRAPGTENYPNKKKRDAGRKTAPCRLQELDPDRRYSFDTFDAFEERGRAHRNAPVEKLEYDRSTVTSECPTSVLTLLDAKPNSKLHKRWHGDLDGLRGNKGDSELDQSVANLLATEGIPAAEIESALRFRRDQSSAAEKHDGYYALTVSKGMESKERGKEKKSTRGGQLAPSKAKRLVTLDAIKPEAIEWLWRGYIPLGKITDVTGDGDLGKSLVMLDLAARISTGEPMPGEAETRTREPRDVVLLVAEDDLKDTVVPRLTAAGAELSRVHAFTEESGVTFPDGVGKIEAAIREKNAALLIIDPVMAFLGEHVRSGVDSSVRMAFSPLKTVLEKYRCACLSLRHITKDKEQTASNRGGGSVAFRNLARAGLAFGPDWDDETEQRRYMAQSKKNLGLKTGTLAYSIKSSHGLVTPEGADGTPIVEWERGVIEGVTLGELFTPPKERGPREGSKTYDATQWILKRLAGGVEVSAPTMTAEMKAQGFSAKVIENAKLAAEVTNQQRKVSADKNGWFWSLPE